MPGQVRSHLALGGNSIKWNKIPPDRDGNFLPVLTDGLTYIDRIVV